MTTAALLESMFSLLLELVSLLSLSCDVIRLSTFAFIIALFLFGAPGMIYQILFLQEINSLGKNPYLLFICSI